MTEMERLSSGGPLDRQQLIERYQRSRARSKELFDLIKDEAYYARPIPRRLPAVFYEGHLPVFNFSTLVKRALGRPSIDKEYEALFARGIDPHESVAPAMEGKTGEQSKWPTRDQVRALAAEADRQVLEALTHGDIDQPGHPLLDRGEAVFCILEHEVLHDETLLYMWHQLPHTLKRKPTDYRAKTEGASPAAIWVDIPRGNATLGTDRAGEDFSWDNERPAHNVSVEDFRIERHDVTNERFMEFVKDGGYDSELLWRPEDWAWLKSEGHVHPSFWTSMDGQWWWRGMFELIDLPPSWPVYVSHAEASAFARWRGLRLPTEAEYQRAAYGSPLGEPRRYPWGNQPPSPKHGVFDFSTWDPEPAGSHPDGASAWGVDDLMGNGWEWTSTVFAPFRGYEPLPAYPQYSADFFDGEHFVLKGASPATSRELLRPSFRNWFRARYPYLYATFRCVDGEPGQRRTR